MFYPMMNYMWGGYGAGGGLGMLIFWVLIIVLVVWVVRAATGRTHMMGMHHSGHMPSKTALDILKERYAKGEINKQEFEEKKKDLA